MTTRTQSHDKPPESHDLITFFFHKHLQPQHPGVCIGRTECHQVQRLELVSLDVDDREALLFGEVASRELEAVGATSCPHLLNLFYSNCSGVKCACGRIKVRHVQLHNIHPPNLYTIFTIQARVVNTLAGHLSQFQFHCISITIFGIVTCAFHVIGDKLRTPTLLVDIPP